MEVVGAGGGGWGEGLQGADLLVQHVRSGSRLQIWVDIKELRARLANSAAMAAAAANPISG